MAADRGDEGVVTAGISVWSHAGIAPIEMWDVLVEGRSLFARRDEPTFFGSLAAAVMALRRGDAVRETGERLARASWRSVALLGGGVDPPRAIEAFAAVDVEPRIVSNDPLFPARAARQMLATTTPISAPLVVCDVGQTAIKTSASRGTFARSRSRSGMGRAAFVGEIARAIADACNEPAAVAPSFLLLGLPCEIEARGDAIVCGPSTYPTAGDGVALARDVVTRAGFAETEVALVNDAVLAAWAHRATRRDQGSPSELVLTMGLGVGAALIEDA
jgi:hypothetical protein